MNLPMRKVKYVVRGALREMAEETTMSPAAPDDAYDDVFNSYLDMLIDWESQSILSGMDIPATINAPLSNAVPAQNLIYMLTSYAAGRYQYTLNAAQMGGSSKAYSDLMSGQCKQTIACNPIPHGYAYYNSWPTQCGSHPHSDSIHGECVSELPIIDNDGTPLVSGT